MKKKREEAASEENKIKKPFTKKKITIISVAALAVIAIVIVTVVILINNGKGKDNNGIYEINKDNYKQINADMNAQVAESYFETYMNTTWTFSDGKTVSKDAVFGNSPNNTKAIRCVVKLDGTGDIVYTSDVLPVGAAVQSIKLSKDLSAGTYPATCTIYLMKEDNGKYTDFSNAGFTITIIVQK